MSLGDFATSAESLASASSSSTSYVTKATLNTPVVVAGDYFVMGTITFQCPSSGNEDVQLDVLQDGVTEIYASGVLQEWASSTDNGMSYQFALKVTLTAAAHTFELRYRRQNGGVTAVAVLDAAMQFFKLDASYQETVADAVTTYNLNPYGVAASLAAGALPAGIYHVGVCCEYRCEVPTPTGACYVWFRRRRDPAGADVITSMLGDSKDAPLELPLNNGGMGVAATDPWLDLAWSVACLRLEADTYTFELLRRCEIAGNQVDLQKIRIFLWKAG